MTMNKHKRYQNNQETFGKVQSHHRDRSAIVYIRQSTLQQVERHNESTKLQYALQEKATALGWLKENVEVIDEDLGRSGANAEGRPGFQKLVTKVSLDQVGIILGIEISRLARSCRDWHQLLEVCSLFRTLIADADGIYDPGNYNDRLLLGLKGTMSEAELHILKQRMLAGKKAKAKRGELGMQLPMGYISHPSGEVIKDPDEQAQSTIELIFKLFDQYRTINGVLKRLVSNGIKMPFRIRGGPNKGDLTWNRPNRATLNNLISNPIYAGAYVYGRRPTDPRKKKPGRPSTGRTVVKQNEWEVLLKDKIPSYISWEEYERNQRQLFMNSSKSIGVARRGESLLSGLIICGRCGLKMMTSYTDNGAKLRYSCHRMAIDYAEDKCQSLSGNALDKLVEKKILEALQPSALEVSLQVAEKFEEERKLDLKHWKQRLERANYETERAYRQYNTVEPENRLVARTLEKKWEESLSSEKQLRDEYERYLTEQPIVLTEQERSAIRALASNIPTLWDSSTTTQEQRKNIVRLMIDRVIVTVQGDTEKVYAEIHWAGGHKTNAVFNRPVGRLRQLSYYDGLINRAATLYGQGKLLKEIADILNKEGWQPPKQRGLFSSGMIRSLLICKGKSSRKKKRSDNVNREKDELTIAELSTKTKTPEPTIYRWITKGKLQARRDMSVSHNGVWLIKADESEIKRLLDLKNQPKQWIYHSRVEKVE